MKLRCFQSLSGVSSPLIFRHRGGAQRLSNPHSNASPPLVFTGFAHFRLSASLIKLISVASPNGGAAKKSFWAARLLATHPAKVEKKKKKSFWAAAFGHIITVAASPPTSLLLRSYPHLLSFFPPSSLVVSVFLTNLGLVLFHSPFRFFIDELFFGSSPSNSPAVFISTHSNQKSLDTAESIPPSSLLPSRSKSPYSE